MQETLLRLKKERDILAEAYLKSIDGAGAESAEKSLDHAEKVRFFLDDFTYGYSCFESDLKQFLKLEYSKLKDKTIWFKDEECKKFVDILIDAQKKLLEEDLSAESKLENFFLAILQGTITNQEKLEKIGSYVRFKSDKLRNEKILAAVEKKEQTPFHAEPTECPRVVVELQTHRYEDYEERVTSTHLVEHMLPYIFRKSESQHYSHLFGFLLSLDGVEIIWINDFIPGLKPLREQIRLYGFDWHFQNLKYFLENFLDKKPEELEEAELGLVSRRPDLDDLLKRRSYIMQSFGIYGGKAGLYDYGPPGCAIKANVEKLWRDHFVIEEDMLEISGTNITPDIVLRASGHEEKFSDIMVNDIEKKEFCYRADHLIEEFIEEAKNNQKTKLTPEKAARYEEILRRINEYKVNDIEAIIQELGIKSPKTGNALSKPYEFNLMFAIQIGPTGDSKGYLRPETAQGIFVNFRNLLEYNGGRIPFACAQLGIGFRNEIAPRGGLLRLREFGMAEIEHFVDPEDKSHPKFDTVKNYAMPLYHRNQQTSGGDAVEMTLADALAQKIINNETLAYFIARTHMFLVRTGIRPEGIRFRQHLGNEMAHYSQDCWDAEVLTSYGWVEVVGIADRSAFDLTRHTKFSKKDLVAARKFTQAKEIEVLEAKLAKPVIGKAFKAENKLIVEALESLDENTRKAASEALATDKTWTLTLEDGRTFAITPEMISFELKKKRVMEEKFTPHVIEPSFGIGRIIYCSFEHSFKMRSKERTYLHLPPKIAPYKCSLLTVVTDPRFDPYVSKIVDGLKKFGISNKVDTTGQGIGKRYARTDEVGIPFGITIDHDTLEKDTVTLREIDTTLQVRVPMSEIVDLVYNLSEELTKWEDVLKKYPQFTPSSQE